MYETFSTVVGTIITNPVTRTSASGDTVVSFRVASNARYFDREDESWKTSSTLYLSVSCWGAVGRRIAGSMAKGDPVICHGRLSTNEWEKDGTPQSDLQMKVQSAGPDLSRIEVDLRRRDRREGTENIAGFGAEPSDGAAATAAEVTVAQSSTRDSSRLVGVGLGDPQPPF